MKRNQVKSQTKGTTNEVIQKVELDALRELAVNQYTGKQKYVDKLYQVMLASPATISAHAQELAGMPDTSGGGNSGTLVKTLRANLRYIAKAHDLKAIPTVKALEKDGPLTLTNATPKPRKANAGKVKDVGEVTLQDIVEFLKVICKGAAPETRAKIVDMMTDAVMEA